MAALEDSFENLVLPSNNHLGRKLRRDEKEAMLEDDFVNMDSLSDNHPRQKCELR